VPPRERRVTADGIVLIRQPDNQDYVERGGGVVEKFGHERLHS